MHTRRAFVHVDMDGLDAIFAAHGMRWNGDDHFYRTAVDGALASFAHHDIKATFFVISRDLDDPGKRSAIQSILDAGHRIASHSASHEVLYRASDAEVVHQVAASRAKLEDSLGVPVEGFRAPGYSVDWRTLRAAREAGYRYDSSAFHTFAHRSRLGLQRLHPEPFQVWPGVPFFEVPLPAPGPFLPPWHPCYAFEIGHWYFRRGLRQHLRTQNYVTVLFHLTDFAERQRLGSGWKIDLYTNNRRSLTAKRRFTDRVLQELVQQATVVTTEDLLAGWPQTAPELNPRTVLGIATTHEAGACIVRDGAIVSAISEERLTRTKLDNRYPPESSIREAIRLAGIPPREIDAVAIAGLNWKDQLAQTLASLRQDARDYHALNDYFPHLLRVAYRAFHLLRAARYDRISDFLAREYGIRPKLWFVEHHEAHAASAYRTGPADRALIVTADGVGDDVCLTVSRGEDGVIRRLRTFFYPHSLGQFYTACTQVLGFRAGRHEGKITGLAGYGSADPGLMQRVEGTLFADPGGGFRLNKKYYAEGFPRFRFRDIGDAVRGRLSALTIDYRNYKPPLRRLLRGYRREDVAAVYQTLLERELVRITAPFNEPTPAVVLAGGVFANVKANMAISEAFPESDIFIFPAMGDGGLCVGAALSVTAEPVRPCPPMYLGTGYNDDEIVAELEQYSDRIAWSRPEDMAAQVAECIRDSQIVARFDGRMEFGPRALGNRSILYHGADRSVNQWLNHRLKRTEFMPFAPICLWEDAERYFHVRAGEKRACEYMTMVVRCTDEMLRDCPAAVHVDGTARPQLLRREVNPAMYDILAAYRRLTGIGCMINTSFNMHEEPIVRSPDDALRSFLESGVHALVLGPFMARLREPIAAPDASIHSPAVAMPAWSATMVKPQANSLRQAVRSRRKR
jgi:carbamoyltransferase